MEDMGNECIGESGCCVASKGKCTRGASGVVYGVGRWLLCVKYSVVGSG